VVAGRVGAPPSVTASGSGGIPEPDLDALIARAAIIDPGTTWSGILFPYGRRAPLEIIMHRSHGDGREYEDTVYFDPYNGEHLATWRYGVNQSAGDWFIWLQIPLHFGTSWGPSHQDHLGHCGAGASAAGGPPDGACIGTAC
jgi:Uncharacterized iron-regulated membrane protein